MTAIWAGIQEPMRVTLYTKPDCVVCGEVLETLRNLAVRYDIEPGEIEVIDIVGQPELEVEYLNRLPIVEVERGKYGRLESPFDEAQLRTQLEIARRALHTSASGASGVDVKNSNAEGSPLDRMARYIGQRWLRLCLIALGIFVGLPWLAPIFSALGWWGLADPIYTAYAVT